MLPVTHSGTSLHDRHDFNFVGAHQIQEIVYERRHDLNIAFADLTKAFDREQKHFIGTVFDLACSDIIVLNQK